MRYKHFYGPAFTSLREKEDEALRLWSSTLRRGMAALQYKRYTAAEIYLGAAYEIGILRLDCLDNTIFDATHVVQPAVHLTDSFLAQGNIASAHSFFNETQHLLQTKAVSMSTLHERVLQEITQALQQVQRGQNFSQPLDKEISDLPMAKPAESRRPRRPPHRKLVLAVQGATS
jgi:hypothetical protein